MIELFWPVTKSTALTASEILETAKNTSDIISVVVCSGDVRILRRKAG